MKELLTRLPNKVTVSVEEVDITGDKTLEKQFGSEIPVLLHKHQVLAKVRISKPVLLEKLRAITS
tara:strand:- start:23 stop:217 length:195 start_codon:yes stop_codon:yes gene_type:complete